ncbi:TonB-dependent receptor [Mucilaginibacter sp. cycad4]|uniref:TonB-dependent receptor n=1 Tax=Mucilaginibacter sp. cycad4 TaxID=3342096 RepID=UPI002AAB73C3|nr:TonB-dependent receptor [Mucilaginibacter gossypii]WPV01074.1 TonB-dependent receptor [Mucilaginibacter gossypii]
MKQFLLALWLSLCLIKSVSAQNVVANGTVHDDQNAPVERATISLQQQGSEKICCNAISDSLGNFQLVVSANATYLLTVTHLGYAPYTLKELNIDPGGRNFKLPAINLKPIAGQLKEVRVLSPPKNYIEHRADRVIINVGALIGNNGTNAIDVLNNVPAVLVTDDGISLRGKEGVVIYIDDKPSYLTGKDLLNYLKNLPSGTLDKIEIMANPPAKYNAEGTAGIINIKTKKGKTKGFNLNLNMGYLQGIYSRNNSGINFNYKVDKFNIFGNIAYSSINNFYDAKRNRQFHYQQGSNGLVMEQFNTETSNTKSYNYQLGFDYDIDHHNSIGAIVYGMISPYIENGLYSTAFKSTNVADSMISTTSLLHYTTRNNTFNLNFRHRFPATAQELNINTDYLHYSTNPLQVINSSTRLPDQTLTGSYILNTFNPFDTKVFGAKVDFDSQLSTHIKISAGLQATYSDRNSTGKYLYTLADKTFPNDSLNGRFGYSENINAAYINFQQTTTLLDLQIGLRYENTYARTNHQDAALATNADVVYNYNNLFPTAYLSYKLDTVAANTLILSLGRRISRPGYSQLNSFVFTFDKYSSNKGNPKLAPAYSNNFDISLNHSNKVTIGFAYSQTHNTIAQYYQLTGYALAFIPVNIDKATAYGLYLNLSLPATPWWNINLYSDINRNHYTGEILDVSYLNNSVTTVTISGNNQFKLKKGWGLEINGSYRNNLTYGQGIYLPMWHLNGSVQKTILKNKGAITLTVRDIFDTRKLRRQIEYQNAYLTSTSNSDNQLIGIAFTYKLNKSALSRPHHSSIGTEADRAGAN